MPNWCSNVLTLTHKDPAQLTRARDAFCRGELLNEFSPVPQELRDTVSGFFGDTDKQRDLEKAQAANIAKYGYSTWYEFCVAEWGTKWDVGSEGTNPEDYPVDGDTLTISFDSAWSPPVAAMAAFEQEGFKVNLSFYESGMAFCGYYSSDEGEEEYSLSDMRSDEVREGIPDWLDDMFAISETMAEWEAEAEEEDE